MSRKKLWHNDPVVDHDKIMQYASMLEQQLTDGTIQLLPGERIKQMTIPGRGYYPSCAYTSESRMWKIDKQQWCTPGGDGRRKGKNDNWKYYTYTGGTVKASLLTMIYFGDDFDKKGLSDALMDRIKLTTIYYPDKPKMCEIVCHHLHNYGELPSNLFPGRKNLTDEIRAARIADCMKRNNIRNLQWTIKGDHDNIVTKIERGNESEYVDIADCEKLYALINNTCKVRGSEVTPRVGLEYHDGGGIGTVRGCTVSSAGIPGKTDHIKIEGDKIVNTETGESITYRDYITKCDGVLPLHEPWDEYIRRKEETKAQRKAARKANIADSANELRSDG